MKLLLATLLFSASSIAHSGGVIITKTTELDYVNESCPGEKHVRLSNRTQVDCLTETHAIEYDKASNWYEALGQSFYYSAMTNKKPGIVLTGVREDKRYLNRLHKTLKHHNLKVDVWCYSPIKGLIECN